MKRWTKKRRDHQHTQARPKSRGSRARRLAFERCEDRIVLSGSSLTVQFVGLPNAGDGGFLAFDSSRFLQTKENDFLLDANGFSPTMNFFDLGNLVSDNIGGESDLSGPKTLGPIVPADDAIATQDDGVNQNASSEDSQDDALPGLSGKTSRFSVINDSIQIVAYRSSTATSAKREGGTLEVAIAINTTQRAYETQLAAIVVHNLNHDETLPVAAPHRMQPIVAELARAVVFETLGQQPAISTGEVDHVTSEQLLQTTQIAPLTSETVSLRQDISQAHYSTTRKVIAEESATHDDEKPTLNGKSHANFAERVDDEQQAAFASTYAQWPALAAVIAGYLMVDRSVASTETSVQKPLRRGRWHGKHSAKRDG